MPAKIWILAALTILGSASLATAQQWGGGPEDWHGGRGEYMHRLREACDYGDDRACWRLRHMREEWREQHEWREHHDENRGGWDGPRAPY